MKKLYIYFNHFIDNPFLKGFPKGGGGGGCLFEGGALLREVLIKYIKKTSKYFQPVSLIKQ